MKKGRTLRSSRTIGILFSALVLLSLCLTGGSGEAAAYPASGGFGSHSEVAADSALAMFLLGLAVGVPVGIGVFFGYLVLREKQETEQDRQMDELLASLSEDGEPGYGPWNNRDAKGDSSRQRLDAEATEEKREPWERPSDWWRES